ncbi:hypothetical protein V5F38_14315 [Xanthobacter sp. V0B-10]|uniref:hypothetical protein n=1 Tax=Xanthobacter albus TaxID=3119929 RepID=UPI003728DB93
MTAHIAAFPMATTEKAPAPSLPSAAEPKPSPQGPWKIEGGRIVFAADDPMSDETLTAVTAARIAIGTDEWWSDTLRAEELSYAVRNGIVFG